MNSYALQSWLNKKLRHLGRYLHVKSLASKLEVKGFTVLCWPLFVIIETIGPVT